FLGMASPSRGRTIPALESSDPFAWAIIVAFRERRTLDIRVCRHSCHRDPGTYLQETRVLVTGALVPQDFSPKSHGPKSPIFRTEVSWSQAAYRLWPAGERERHAQGARQYRFRGCGRGVLYRRCRLARCHTPWVCPRRPCPGLGLQQWSKRGRIDRVFATGRWLRR